MSHFCVQLWRMVASGWSEITLGKRERGRVMNKCIEQCVVCTLSTDPSLANRQEEEGEELREIKHSAAPHRPITLHLEQDVQHGPYVSTTNCNLLAGLLGANWKKVSVCFPWGVRRAQRVWVGWGGHQGPNALRPSPRPASPLMLWSMVAQRWADSVGRWNHCKEESFREDWWDALISLK